MPDDSVPEAARAALRRARAGSREQDHAAVPGSSAAASSRTTRLVRARIRRSPGIQFSGPGPDARDPARLGDLVEGLLRDSGWTQSLAAARLHALWPQIVGATNAEHARPEGFDPASGILEIRTTSTAWAESLRLMLPELRQAIDSAVGTGAVRDIRINGPVGRTTRGRLRVRGRGPRDTYG